MLFRKFKDSRRMSYTFLTVFARARDFRVKNLEFKQKLEVYTKNV